MGGRIRMKMLQVLFLQPLQKYFRFVYDKQGSEPGSEDLDAAKMETVIKSDGYLLSDEPVINQLKARMVSIWRVSASTTEAQVPTHDAIPLKSIIDLTKKIDAEGNLDWTPPAGQWIVVRIGHTSTGIPMPLAGEVRDWSVDKFNAAANQIAI